MQGEQFYPSGFKMQSGPVNLSLLAKRRTVSTWVDHDGESGTLLAGRASQASRLTAIRTRITMIISFHDLFFAQEMPLDDVLKVE